MSPKSSLTRKELLLSLPALAVARKLLAQEAPIGVLGLHSVTLAVSDMARSLEFYQALFGAPIQARHRDGTVLLRIGNGPRFFALTEAGDQGPRIDHWGLAVEGYNLGRLMGRLEALGLTRVTDGPGLAGGPSSARLTARAGIPEVFMSDPDGLVMQLSDPSYCGGAGMLGDTCALVEPSPVPGDLALLGISHLTVNVSDPEATNAFYQRLFGFGIQAYQAASPLLGVGPGSDFLMFIGGRNGAAGVNHACFYVADFNVARIQGILERHGISPQDTAGPGPMRHRVSMRMPNRGGAPEGTPELYFTDPDGLSIQLQDLAYCGGGGYLGGECID